MVVSSQETVDGARPAREAVDGRGMSSRCLDIEILYTVPAPVCVCVCSRSLPTPFCLVLGCVIARE